MSKVLRHCESAQLEPADDPSVRPEVCSDLGAGDAEVTVKIPSEEL